MPPSPRYSKPPIVEALLDIQVDLPGSFRVDDLLKCQQRVKQHYPERTNAQHVTSHISIGLEVTTSASTRPAGYVFSTPDKTQLFQARVDGFTYNRLGTYPGWDVFVAEAKRLWEEYRRVTHPRGYKRVALRFINRFDFPEPVVNMETFFRTHPQVSPVLPQQMAHFFYQVHLALADIQSAVSITQTAVKAEPPAQVSILLDLDLYRTTALPPGNELWPLFETMREWKNRVFEACITDATRELIT